MMYPLTLLVLCAGPALGYPATLIPGYVQDSLQGYINNSNDAAQLSSRLASQFSEDNTATTNNFFTNLALFTSTALKGWVDNFKQFLNICSQFVSGVPFVGTTVGIGNNALKAEATLLNTVGQNVIETSHNVTSMNLSALNEVVQTNLDAFQDASDLNADVISELARDDVEALNEGAQETYAAFDSFYNALADEDFYYTS